MTTEIDPFFHRQQQSEFDAWQLVMSELRKRGWGDVNNGGNDQRLAEAIMAWGEELAELRRLDPMPEHGRRALAEKRALIDAWDEES